MDEPRFYQRSGFYIVSRLVIVLILYSYALFGEWRAGELTPVGVVIDLVVFGFLLLVWLAFFAQFVLPVIVLVNVSSADYAAFYAIWSVTVIVFLIPHTLGQVLLVEGGRTANLRHQLELALVLSGRWPMSCVNPTVLPHSGLRRWQPVSMQRGPNA